MKQETLSPNKGSTLLKGKNEQFTTPFQAAENARWTRARSTSGHFPTALAPGVTSLAAEGRGVKVKCAETVGCRAELRGRERQSETKEKCGG